MKILLLIGCGVHKGQYWLAGKRDLRARFDYKSKLITRQYLDSGLVQNAHLETQGKRRYMFLDVCHADPCPSRSAGWWK